MKQKLTLLLIALFTTMGAWAALSSSTIAKSGNVTDTWNITSALPTNDWVALADPPSGLPSGTPFYRTQDLTISDEGALSVTFLYTSGSHRLDILGVDLLNSSNEVVRSDYHTGYTGGNKSHNVYLLDHIASGTYKIRFIINNAGTTSSSGTITVKHVNIKTANSFAEITNWYFVRMHSTYNDKNMYYDSNSANGIAFGSSQYNNAYYLWGFVKDTDGIRIYNKAAGSSFAIDNANPCTLSADGTSLAFTIDTGNAGNHGAAADAYFSLYMNSGSKSYLNYQSDAIKRYGNNDQGSTFMIYEAPFVDDAAGKVYTIQAYFSTEGYSNRYFTNNDGTLAFNTAASNGVKDYWILRPSGNMTYPWKFESGRGDGNFLSPQTGVSTTGGYVQINNCDGTHFHLYGGNNDAAGGDIRNLGTWSPDASKSGFARTGNGGCWGTDHYNATWTTDYIIEEASGVDIYTVVTNINGGGVTYTPAYTGTATQAKGGFYIFDSAPSSDDFTATDVDNCTAGNITVDASAKTITVHYTPSPIQITDVASISGIKVYRLRSDRAAIYAASASATAASATSTANASTLDVEDPLNQWAFVEKDGKKYLYNVGAKKFLKTSPYVDFNNSDYGQYANSHNFLEPYTTHEVQISTYSDITGRFFLKDVKGGRTRVYNSGNGSFTINGWTSSDGASNSGNGWIIEEIPNISFNPTEALAALDNSISYTFRKVNGDTDTNLTSSDEERDVAIGSTLAIGYEEGYYSPILKLKDIKVNGNSSSVGTKTILNGDVIEWVFYCPFNVSDEPSEGSFAANTYWHFLDINSGSHYYLNIPEGFDYTNKIPANTTTKSLADDFLWCITGNNTDGYRLYNKQAGPTKVMTFTSGTGAFMSALSGNEEASLFTMAHTNLSGSNNTTGAPTFQFAGATARPNFDHVSAVASWANSDKGSEFTFEPVEVYIDELLVNNYMPYFVQNIGYMGGLSWDDALMSSTLAEEYAAVYTNPTVEGYNTFRSHLEAAKVQPVENATYHIVSAYPAYQQQQNVKKALYYDTSASKFMWKTYEPSDESFTFQLRKTGDNWNIYSPNAGKYLKECAGDANTSDNPTTFTFLDLGLAQLNINDATTNNHSLHTGGHSSGAGVNGNITNWPGGSNSASSWYIVPVVESISAISPAAVAADADVYQTFANPYNCQIANAEVHYITTQTTSTAHIEKASNEMVPANTGVILKAKKGATISIRPLNGTCDENLTSNNTLIAGDGTTTVAAGNYMLAYSSTDEMAKFYAIGSSGFVVPANKAYLPASGGASVKALSFDDDDATGINAIKNNELTIDNAIYNVAGQRMSKMQKGINIVNGKKILK